MKKMVIDIGMVLAAALLSASSALAGMVTYPLNLSTSLGNPVTDILILENDGALVHASIYADDLPGTGPAVINHTVPFTPVQTLVIALTEGTDGMGNDKTQIIMLLDKDFAAANDGVQFSSVFPGAKHSVTIANLQAAVAGDAAQLAWFTDTFFSGPAAGAAFVSGGPFSVVEFTVGNVIGGNAAFGNWMITGFQALPPMMGLPTAEIEETAKIDCGPFDIVVQVSDSGGLTVDKTVLNNTGRAWTGFKINLGTGSGGGFVPAAGGLFFPLSPVSETTGAFPELERTSNTLAFKGLLPPGGTAHFVFDVRADDTEFTLRQIAACSSDAVPAADAQSLLALALVLAGIAAFKLRGRLGGS
jgi:hypothetical protein